MGLRFPDLGSLARAALVTRGPDHVARVDPRVRAFRTASARTASAHGFLPAGGGLYRCAHAIWRMEREAAGEGDDEGSGSGAGSGAGFVLVRLREERLPEFARQAAGRRHRRRQAAHPEEYDEGHHEQWEAYYRAEVEPHLRVLTPRRRKAWPDNPFELLKLLNYHINGTRSHFTRDIDRKELASAAAAIERWIHDAGFETGGRVRKGPPGAERHMQVLRDTDPSKAPSWRSESFWRDHSDAVAEVDPDRKLSMRELERALYRAWQEAERSWESEDNERFPALRDAYNALHALRVETGTDKIRYEGIPPGTKVPSSKQALLERFFQGGQGQGRRRRR
jgi:hypothetical protein